MRLQLKYDAGANIYCRLFNSQWQAFDFDDDTFKALASGTTPQIAATEVAAALGTGQSGYYVDLTPADIHAGTVEPFLAFFYDNASPAITDNPVVNPIEFHLEAGLETDPWGAYWTLEPEINMKSTDGSAAQLALRLLRNGVPFAIDDLDASPTATVTVREHGASAATLKFTKSFTSADLVAGILEGEVSSPGLVGDRQHDVRATLTAGDFSFSAGHQQHSFG